VRKRVNVGCARLRASKPCWAAQARRGPNSVVQVLSKLVVESNEFLEKNRRPSAARLSVTLTTRSLNLHLRHHLAASVAPLVPVLPGSSWQAAQRGPVCKPAVLP
jgi:hypothetical protein